jgi:hypothetical protein
MAGPTLEAPRNRAWPVGWSNQEQRRLARMGALAAAAWFLAMVGSVLVADVNRFLGMIVFGAGLALPSLILGCTLLAVELSRPAPRSAPKLVVRYDEARIVLRGAEQRAKLLVRARDPRSLEDLAVLRRLIARVYAQQALLQASRGDGHRFRSAVRELREELLASARTVMISAPPRRTVPLQR